MGGYHGKAVVVVPHSGGENECFDVYVWHDGSFPFPGDERDPNVVELHHCSPLQFIRFGELILGLQERHPASPGGDE